MGAWYKEFYLITPPGEVKMRAAITDPVDGPANRADVEKRLSELQQIPDDRCHISRDQKNFLTRVLST